MTGLHPHQVGIGHMTEPPNQPLGIRGPYQGFLNNDCRTLAQVLGSTGYHTIMTGKWHLGHADQNNWPLQRGFQYFYGGISGAFNYFKPGAIGELPKAIRLSTRLTIGTPQTPLQKKLLNISIKLPPKMITLSSCTSLSIRRTGLSTLNGKTIPNTAVNTPLDGRAGKPTV